MISFFRAFTTLILSALLVPGISAADTLGLVKDLATKHEKFCQFYVSATDCSFVLDTNDLKSPVIETGLTQDDTQTLQDRAAATQLNNLYQEAATLILTDDILAKPEQMQNYVASLQEINRMYPQLSAWEKKATLKLAHTLNMLWALNYAADYESWLTTSNENISTAMVAGWLLYSVIRAKSFDWTKTGMFNRVLKSRLAWSTFGSGALVGLPGSVVAAQHLRTPVLPPPPSTFLTFESMGNRSSDLRAQMSFENELLSKNLSAMFIGLAASSLWTPTLQANNAVVQTTVARQRFSFLTRFFKLSGYGFVFTLVAEKIVEWTWDSAQEQVIKSRLLNTRFTTQDDSDFKLFKQTLNEWDYLRLLEDTREIQGIDQIFSFIGRSIHNPVIRDVHIELDHLAGHLAAYREMRSTCERPHLLQAPMQDKYRKLDQKAARWIEDLRRLSAAVDPVKQNILNSRIFQLQQFRTQLAIQAESWNSTAVNNRLKQLFPCRAESQKPLSLRSP